MHFHSFCAEKLFLRIKHSTNVLVQTKKKNFFLQNIASNFLFFFLFSFMALKMLKIEISTSVWSVQHPNICQNTTLNAFILHWYREKGNFSKSDQMRLLYYVLGLISDKSCFDLMINQTFDIYFFIPASRK